MLTPGRHGSRAGNRPLARSIQPGRRSGYATGIDEDRHVGADLEPVFASVQIRPYYLADSAVKGVKVVGVTTSVIIVTIAADVL